MNLSVVLPFEIAISRTRIGAKNGRENDDLNNFPSNKFLQTKWSCNMTESLWLLVSEYHDVC